MEWKINRTVVRLTQGDITELAVEAIVNAANAQLALGGGVAGAIRRKGGPSIQEECNRIGRTRVGGAVLTGGGELKAKHVIHAVGPRLGEGDEERKLADAVRNSLRLADENGIRSIAFPAISTGIFGYPLDRAARVMVAAVNDYLGGDTRIEEVIFCLFDRAALGAFQAEAASVGAGPDPDKE